MPAAPYPLLSSSVDRDATAFRDNDAANRRALDEIEAALAEARAGGGDKYNQRHLAAGKLLPRQRIELLLDRDSHFLELCPLAGYRVPSHAPGASMVAGIGVVSGVEVLISASEATVKGGAIGELGVRKTARMAEIAEQNRLPTINMIESAGADLPNQSKIFVPGGAGFRDLTRRSRERIPTVCLVFGSSTAGGAYIPGMSDYVVMVAERAQVYLAGPPLVKMATGEDADAESLGGAAMHSRTSGVSDFLAESEHDAIRLGREIVAHLNWRKRGPEPERLSEQGFASAGPTMGPGAAIEAPRYDPEELLGIASADIKVPFEAREVIARIVDGSRFSEFKPQYGSTLVCGWARVHGYPVGILANNGILFSESANKGAQFIALCNQSDIPLLFLQNITGFMVGTRYEQEGIIKNGAKLINAVSNSTVPAITIMTGASFGAGNYGMCGRAYEPRFLFSWPNHRIAVMGGKQLGGVLEIIQRQAAAKKGREVDEKGLSVAKAMIESQIERESTPLFATARLWDDGIIDPRHTREVVAISLSAAHSAPVRGTMAWGVYRH
ncbi:acyl-CoA carboxylase subunit beta [Haliangium ochraceum]|uniref:Carboxyl transferase n=1 Tax=Haliangium ochraceum (strain DSM 14365 / JCM 11303 / SMP-2) TaxID=502025 RepID=D0LVI2_HALO1|nr:carboxyl transferase domain-containing protein [Haliangium ochraceum]ACY17543.1 carboxyl transferase [Haliangium ochraceum DSM 14365]